MYVIEAVILILLFSVISVPVANRLRLPLEVFLLLGGCVIGMILQLPNFDVNPVVVFNVFLPIILFYAAYFSSLIDFKLYKGVIFLLSVVLVAFTMCVVAYVAKLVVPDLSWAECFLLGAIISPTDASAATSIIKKLNAPKYIITILEAESLLNDASALILFRFALLATISATFSFSDTILQFVIVGSGGVALGLVLGIISLFLLLRVQSSVAATTLTFVTAIGTYLMGEYLGVSSVIATVTSGIYFGIKLPELNSSGSRVQGRASWDTLIFIINSMAFALIGLELPVIIKDMPPVSAGYLVLCGVVVTFAVVVARIFWIYMSTYVSRWLLSLANIRQSSPSNAIQFLLGWCGMRGIVSLAAVLSIPALIPSGTTIPHLDTILFLTYFVIAATLILPSLTLPIFVSWFGLHDIDDKQKQEALARLEVMKKVYADLDKIAKHANTPSAIVYNYKAQLQAKMDILENQVRENSYSILSDEFSNLQKMSLASISDERRIILAMRKSGEIQDEVFNKLLEELDREELRANTLRL